MVETLQSLNSQKKYHTSFRNQAQRLLTGSFFITLLSIFSHVALSQPSTNVNRAKLEKIKTNIAQLKKELSKTRSTRDDIKQNIQKTEQNIIQLKQKADTLKKQINNGEQTLETLNKESASLHIKKKAQQRQVSQHIKAAYQSGTKTTIAALLNQEDPAQVSRNMHYYRYVVSARKNKIDAFNDTLKQLKEVEAQRKNQTQRLKDNHKKLISQHKELRNKQKNRSATIAKLESLLSNNTQELSSLESNQNTLIKLLTQVADILSPTDLTNNTQKFSLLKGKLPWPTTGRVKHKYGSWRMAKNIKWQGMLISANIGEAVRSVHHGRVVFADYLRGHGLLIIVDHGAGYLSLYAHNDSLYKSLGDWVEAGEIISHVGNTGGQKYAGLYFELRYKGKPQNPLRWLRPA